MLFINLTAYKVTGKLARAPASRVWVAIPARLPARRLSAKPCSRLRLHVDPAGLQLPARGLARTRQACPAVHLLPFTCGSRACPRLSAPDLQVTPQASPRTSLQCVPLRGHVTFFSCWRCLWFSLRTLVCQVDLDFVLMSHSLASPYGWLWWLACSFDFYARGSAWLKACCALRCHRRAAH